MAEDISTKIVFKADTSDAERKLGVLGRLMPNAFNAGVTALNGLREGINKVMGALGLFGLAVNGINAVIEAYKGLRAYIERTATEARKLGIDIANSNYEVFITRAADAYDKLNKKIAETLALEKERQGLEAQRTNTFRAAEDAQAELAKQTEIAALNPASDTYAEDKQAIERKYAAEQADRAYARAAEDNQTKADNLRQQATAKDNAADALQQKYDAANAKTDEYVEQNFKAQMRARRTGTDEDKQRAEETDKQWKAAFDFAQKIKREMEAARQEAERLRAQAGELAGNNLTPALQRDAAKLALDTQQREADAAAQKKADEQAEREQADARAKSDAAAEFAAQAEQEKKAAAQQNATNAESQLGKLLDASASSGNRLTAMGLGDGTSGNRLGVIGDDIRRLVDLMRQNVDATKNIRTTSAQSAVWGE